MSRYYSSDPEALEHKKPSACANFLRYTWKTITCLFSHITLVSMVVSYCILGAVTFQTLEEENEKEVKRNIGKMRGMITDKLWNLTTVDSPVLIEENFTRDVIQRLKDFESGLLKAITKDGWDGDENTDNVQWSLAGALFYSIIVITTIGYGHIAPKTTWGKVVTIFYAILGIPLMLLCLSNIGDIMATSFRFLYWKVCCYVCTKKPKRHKRGMSQIPRRPTMRLQGNTRSRTSSFKRSLRTSTRSADSGFAFSDVGPSSHSDTELRFHEDHPVSKRGQSLPRMQPSQRSRFSDEGPPVRRPSPNARGNNPQRGGSLDRRRAPKVFDIDPSALAKAPVYCNRYVMDKADLVGNHVPGITYNERPARNASPPLQGRRALSMPRSQHYLEPPRDPSPSSSSIRDDDQSKQQRRRKNYNPSPRIMSPMGYGHRSKYLDDPGSDDEYFYEEGSFDTGRVRIKPVPIWLCVFLVISYIFAGMFLFTFWEGWDYLDSAYFCFITLTTIGFGDFVPANRVKKEKFKENIAYCSLYLLFGISLLAMSFNLVQEEVIANVKRVAKTLGIIKGDEDDDEDDD
ncbi:PREDICTED: uncharacterized protein LOC108558341 isoform X2 [Nicrophorus vespilloides]|uniref:Uncharacterized protein LOC108558341 isoform X2 n=1 Tax=Nicrophorus vespilloides TaxID=110193 RepID=A0ABM1M823_NICVS|nr:PREDICTED: uncharacterized protein LOC108558341 isoform X2 [Nicrophorus vespilloides]